MEAMVGTAIMDGGTDSTVDMAIFGATVTTAVVMVDMAADGASKGTF